MRNKLLWNIVFIVVFLLMLAGEALAILALFHLNMLPKVYLMALAGVFAFFSLIIGLLLFIRGRRPGKTRQIIACVLALLVFLGTAAITTVANDVMKTIKATSQSEDGMAVRVVYVLEDNPVRTLKGTAGYTYGYLKNYDESCTQQALEELTRQTNDQIMTAGYTTPAQMIRALLEERIDAVVLNGGYFSILEETEEFVDISRHVRILSWVEVDPSIPWEGSETTEILEETQPTEPVETQPEEPEVDYTSLEPFIVYVSGSDSYDSEIVMNSRSDVNILAVVNPMTKQILLVNTPRDYYIHSAYSGKLDKLTHCGIYGTGCSMKTLGNLYDAKIDYYVRINFTGFKKLIDALGGVTVYSDYAFTAITRTKIAKGENHLTGQQALDFARERYTLKGGDNERGKHQMQVITAVIEKATDGNTIISNYSDIMASVEGMFSMDVPVELIGNLMKMQLSDMASWNVVSYSATGSGSMEECYSLPGMELSVLKPNQSSVSKAIRLIDMVCEGEFLTEEVVNSIL